MPCKPVITENRLWEPTPSQQPGMAINAQIHPALGWFPGVRDFDTLSDDVALGGSGTEFTQIHTYSVGDGYIAVCQSIGFDANAVAAWQEVEWLLKVNGSIRLTFPARGQQAGISPNLLRPVYIAMQEGDSVSLWARNTGSSTNTVRACLKGRNWMPSVEFGR